MDATDISSNMRIAIACLCDNDSFARRLANASIALIDDGKPVTGLTDDLKEDLEFVLGLTTRNMKEGQIQNEPNEEERRELIEKMLGILLKTDKS